MSAKQYVKSPAYLWVGVWMTSRRLWHESGYRDRAANPDQRTGIFILDSIAVWCKVLAQFTGGDSLEARRQMQFFETAPSLKLTAYRKLIRPVRDELGEELQESLKEVQTRLHRIAPQRSQTFAFAQTLRWENPQANRQLVSKLLMGFDVLPQYQDPQLLAQVQPR